MKRLVQVMSCINVSQDWYDMGISHEFVITRKVPMFDFLAYPVDGVMRYAPVEYPPVLDYAEKARRTAHYSPKWLRYGNIRNTERVICLRYAIISKILALQTKRSMESPVIKFHGKDGLLGKLGLPDKVSAVSRVKKFRVISMIKTILDDYVKDGVIVGYEFVEGKRKSITGVKILPKLDED